MRRVLMKDPGAFEANLQMGQYLLSQDDIAAAVEYLERASQRQPDHVPLLGILANAHKALGQYDKSEDAFRRAVAVAPNDFALLYEFGLFLHSLKRLEDAVEIFERAVALDPSQHELLNDVGVICYQLERYDDARRFLHMALDVKPDYILASVNLGYVHVACRDYKTSQEILASLLARQPDNPEVIEFQRMLGSALDKAGQEREQMHAEISFSDQRFEIMPLHIIKNFGNGNHLEPVELSVVIPICNERENITILYKELNAVLSDLKECYEIIFVNDGSYDGSREILDGIAEKDTNVKVVHFRRNYGQTAAMNAGFKLAQGSVVITMDGDLQNDPADIPRLLEKMAQGYDLVSGWRKDRQDKALTRVIPSMVANHVINHLIAATGVQLHDYGCTLKAYKRGIVKNINLYGEMHRFIPCFAAWLGVKVTEITVNHRPRVHGYAKYNLSRVSRVIFDLIVVRFFADYMTRPIQFFGKIAKKLLGAGLAFIIILSLVGMLTSINITANFLILIFALLMFAVIQIITMGLLGEIMVRSYFETQHKDYYIVEKIINE